MGIFSSESLQPTLFQRFRVFTSPGWLRTLYLRRCAAVGLILVAIGGTLMAKNNSRTITVVTAARELAPGTKLIAADVTTVAFSRGTIPHGALLSTSHAVGNTITSPVRRGEPLTDWRILHSRLPAQLTGDPDARLVPVQLADKSVVALLRVGDVVDVISPTNQKDHTIGELDRAESNRNNDSTVILAAGAIVAAIGREANGPRDVGNSGLSSATTIMLALPKVSAQRVAGASLLSPITVIFH